VKKHKKVAQKMWRKLSIKRERERNLIKSFLKYIQWPLPVAFYYVKTHKRCTRGRHDPSQIAIAQMKKKIEKK
jgi:hypothetical protein